MLLEIGNSDGYVIVTTEDGQFYVYEYMFVGVSNKYCIYYFIVYIHIYIYIHASIFDDYFQKFQRKIVHQINGLQTVVPFHYDQYNYLLFGTKTNTTIMRIVQQGLLHWNHSN